MRSARNEALSFLSDSLIQSSLIPTKSSLIRV
jgi:hypothetical protein